MDLVDIDQMLDNLELREAADEKNKSARSECSGSSQLSIVRGGNGASHRAGFVGVSQVFTSLDDYRKNVEALDVCAGQRYDEECQELIGERADNAPYSICTEKAEVDSAEDGRALRSPVPSDHVEAVISVCGAPSAHNEYGDDAEDEEASNDLHKFTENADVGDGRETDEADDSTTVTSESLTTSSSSTFSSGPSPGLASTTEEPSALSTANDYIEESDARLAAGAAPLRQAELAKTEALTVGGNVVVLEDLATGFSSISLTSANLQLNLPCEATVSSVLENVFEDLSVTTSTSLLSQQRNHDRLASGQLSEKSSAIEVLEGKESGCAMKTVGAKIKPELSLCKSEKEQNYSQPKETRLKQPQPITFGSTMDEISDTELDSMLQEMDIDDIADVEEPSKLSNNISLSSSVAGTAAAQLQNKDDSADRDEVESHVSGVDCLNADSFSQASTVEFSEIRAQCMEPIHGTDGGQSSNSVASSYSSSESSLDGGNVVEQNNAELAYNNEFLANTEEAVRERNDKKVGEDSAEEDAEEAGEMRPQRPTTLDLPVLKSNLYSNAGQTPPGANVLQQEVASAENMEDGAGLQHEEQGGDSRIDSSNGSVLMPTDDVAEASGYSDPHTSLGKIPPIWVPDNMAASCMQCHVKFTMIKRRHHCRACGKVLCSICCSQKFKLEFLNSVAESRVCLQCYLILTQRKVSGGEEGSVGEGIGDDVATSVSATSVPRSPNPNNPMEYCSTIPPHRQVSAGVATLPPSVIVPVGVLKKDGSYSSNSSNGSSKKGRKRKSVMFSDGIAPGSDLANMENQWVDAKHARRGHQQSDKSRSVNSASNKPPTPAKSQPSSNSDATTIGLVASLFRGSIPPLAATTTVSAAQSGSSAQSTIKDAFAAAHSKPTNSAENKTADLVATRSKRLPPTGCDKYGCFIPEEEDNCLPPIFVSKDDRNCDFDYKEVVNNGELIERLQRETLKFALTKNFYVLVKIVNLKCCMNRTVINFTTCGMHCVGNDELVILLEYEPTTVPGTTITGSKGAVEPLIPKDIFVHLYEIYREAELNNPISELSYTNPRRSNFLGSREYGGFIFIRATFQCLLDVIVPENPFLIGILIHRNEVPWAKVFPLRLMLRLGAQYRYYPCPHISMRNRESVYADIAQTIINFLADFRNYSYTLPCIKGMYIHMEDRQTTVLIPRNRQEEVVKAIKNASDHILAFGGNFSKTADGHLVCMQNVHDAGTEMYAYSTQAINIQGQPRKVTGASFFVLNEALKSTSGLSGKCSIVEDGLMVQILPAKMEEVRNALQNQKDIEIVCGPVDAEEQQTEVVSIKWVENDRDFNLDVTSPIDGRSMEGISSMRVHDSFNYSNVNYSIRLTDIYILKFDEWYVAAQAAMAATSLDITRMAGQIARSASMALVPFLDLLAASGSRKLALRATLHQDNVCYEAGTRGSKLPPLYMNALDNHLIPTLHGESSGMENAIILELIFYILNA